MSSSKTATVAVLEKEFAAATHAQDDDEEEFAEPAKPEIVNPGAVCDACRRMIPTGRCPSTGFPDCGDCQALREGRKPGPGSSPPAGRGSNRSTASNGGGSSSGGKKGKAEQGTLVLDPMDLEKQMLAAAVKEIESAHDKVRFVAGGLHGDELRRRCRMLGSGLELVEVAEGEQVKYEIGLLGSAERLLSNLVQWKP